MEKKEDEFIEAVRLLRRGEVVAFPTETVYGLGALLFSEEAVQKIFTLKGRPSDNPLIAHIAHLEEASKLALELPPAFFLLAERFWPGPLTIVLRKRIQVPALVSAGHPTIAIRMPSHPLARRLIEAVGEPLAAPSANLSGRPSPTSAFDVREDFGGRLPLILDGGDCSIGIESTVISLIGSSPILLRPGAIDQKEIESVLESPILPATIENEGHSPGMKYRHYAPRAKIRLVFEEALIPLEASYLLSSESIPGAKLFNRQNFYACLREADRLGVSEIVIYCSQKVEQDRGLMNRIFRSAGMSEEAFSRGGGR